MIDNIKWIDCDKLEIINDENNSKYDSFDNFVEQNIDSLMNHNLENIKIEELCEHILNKYQYDVEREIEYHLERLYARVFRFIYLPETQNYFMKLEIGLELNHIEEFLTKGNDEEIKEFIKEKSEWYIDNFKFYYENGFGIKKSYNIATADVLVDTYREDVIKKYMEDPNIIY